MKLTLCLSSLLFTLHITVFNAYVTGITDGDSITVLTDRKEQIKIRLEGIDCPELDQDFGVQAKQATSSLCFNKNVRIEKTGTDRYGRTLAYVYTGDICVNKELLKLGMAWHYKKYNSDSDLASLENFARKRKIGLWSTQKPVAPWIWRKEIN